EEYPEYCDLIEMGAIGVGSSNDAHKPFLQRKRPYLRVNRNRLKKIDIGQVEWEYSGQRFQRYFLLNTSIGITSQANHLFNSNELWWLPLLKKISTGLAIHAVALYSLFKNKTYKVDLEIDGARHCWAINNLAVLKRKHFGGGFKFDQEPDLDDGDLMVKANFDLSMMGLFKTALGLTKGYFPRSESNFSQRVKRLHIVHRDNTPLNLEVDGEVFPATQVWWNIHSKAMSVIC
ncbi:MAG: hypothetical protein KDD61_02780, partial [Bdellovibrionales bacterium]|nr:hypothetical protein [Bdellovibrionales bacterium]